MSQQMAIKHQAAWVSAAVLLCSVLPWFFVSTTWTMALDRLVKSNFSAEIWGSANFFALLLTAGWGALALYIVQPQPISREILGPVSKFLFSIVILFVVFTSGWILWVDAFFSGRTPLASFIAIFVFEVAGATYIAWKQYSNLNRIGTTLKLVTSATLGMNALTIVTSAILLVCPRVEIRVTTSFF